MIGRLVDGGLHEDIEITNNSQRPVRFNLEVAVRADFADIFEVKGDSIGAAWARHIITSVVGQAGNTSGDLSQTGIFCRELIVRTGEGDGRPTVYANGRLSFDIALKPGQAWHRCLIYDLVDGSKHFRASKECIHSSETSDHSRNIHEMAAKRS